MSHQFGAVHPNDPPEIRDKLLSEQDVRDLEFINANATFHECEAVSYDDAPAGRAPGWFRSLYWPVGSG